MHVVSAHQPAYFPWLGLLHKIWLADLFVVFDCVSFEKGSFINRNRFQTPSGGWCWLTMPVSTAGDGPLHERPIFSLCPDEGKNWRRKHLDHLRHTYAKSPHFKTTYPAVESFFKGADGTLADICVASTRLLLDAFGIKTPLIRSSAMGLKGRKNDRVFDLAVKTNANVFIFGALGKDYADQKLFSEGGVATCFQNFAPPVYHQGGKSPFISRLSALDFLFWAGPDLPAAFEGNLRRENLAPNFTAVNGAACHPAARLMNNKVDQTALTL